MFGSRAGRAAKFIPMPTMSWVNTSADGCRIKADVRLNAMTNPFRDIGDGGAHVRWPVWVSVLKLQPRKHVLEFIRGGSKGDAIIEIDAAITQSKKLGAQKVVSAKTAKMQSRAVENIFQTFPASPSIDGQPAMRVRCSADRPARSRRSREFPLRKRAAT